MRRAIRRRLALIAALSACVVTATTSCADQPKIWFENQRDEAVTIAIDGDRLVILRPHTWEYLPYSSAAWAWPRKVEIATYSTHRTLWTGYYNADDLARERWRIHVIP